jgi:serine/threonine protein kinase
LHTKGIVHHDIKPQNILYRRDSNGGIEAAICDFESCCIPYIIDARWLELSWGPYEHTKTRVEARIAEDDVSDSSREIDHHASIKNQIAQYERKRNRDYRRHRKAFRAQEDPRWEDSWNPIRWTTQYRLDDWYASAWALDSFSLAAMLEELDEDSNDPVLREVSALLKNDPLTISVDEDVSRLGQVGDLLDKWDSGLK